MKYDHFTMLPERAFQPRNGRTGMTFEGGGGGGGHTTSTVTQSNIPEYLRPQVEAVLGAGMQEYFNTQFNPETGTYDITGTKPYTPFSEDAQDYFAPFSQQQQQVFGEAAGMRTPGGFQTGQQMTGMAGQGGLDTAQQAFGFGQLGTGYGATGAQLGQTGGQQYGGLGAGYGTLGAGLAPQAQLYGQQGADYGATGVQLGVAGGQQYGGLGAGYGMLGAGLAPQAQLYGETAASMTPEARMYGAQGAGYGASAADLTPEAQRYGSRAAEIGEMGLRAEELGRDIGSEARGFARQSAGMGGTYEQMATDPRSMQAYMSPYMQNVIEIQKQQAIEDAQRAQLGANLGAARQGTYGGARQALAQSQREAGLNKQLSDIQGRGLQDAFQQAQQAQQFGVTSGLQGLQGAQTGLGTALQGGQLGLSGIGQAMSGQQTGIQGLGQAGQLYGLGIQGTQAGLSGVDRAIAAQQAGLAGIGRAGEMYGLGMQGAGVGLQGVQQQLAGTAQGMQGVQTGLSGIGRAGEMYGLGMQGAQTGLAGVDRQLAGTAQGMQGAGVGLAGLGAAQAGYGLTGAMGAQFGNLSAAEQNAILQRLGFQGQMGGEQRQFEQDIINQQIQNFALGEEMPFQRLAGYNALLRGYVTPTTTTSQYQAAPSGLSQLAGLGTTGAAMYGLSNIGKKEGGVIKLAEGGITDVDAIEGYAEDLSIPQLKQSMQSGQLKGKEYIGMPILQNKVAEAERMKMAQAMMGQQGQQGQPQSISDALMAKADQLQGITDIVEPIEAAGGGVVAFEDGGAIRFQNQGYVDPMFSGIYSEPSAPREELVDLMTLQELQEYNRSGLIPPRLKDAVGGRQVESGSLMFGAPAMRRPAQFAEPVPKAPAAPTQKPLAATAPPAQRPPTAGIAPPPAGQTMMPSGEMSVKDFQKRQEAFGISDDPDADLRKQIEDMAAGSKSEREQAKYMALLQAGLGIMGGTSPFALQNIAAGAQKGVAQYAGDIKDIKAQERDAMKMKGELARAADARKRGDFKSFMDAEDKARKFELDIAEQATRDRMAGIQEQYMAGRLSAAQAKNETDKARLGLLQQQVYGKARKQFVDEGGEAKLQALFAERFGKNWIKDTELEQSFKQQMEAEIRRIAMMGDLGVPSADDLLGN